LCTCNTCDGIHAHDGDSLNSHTTKRILGGNIEKSISKQSLILVEEELSTN
jgi:hypothetical protein